MCPYTNVPPRMHTSLKPRDLTYRSMLEFLTFRNVSFGFFSFIDFTLRVITMQCFLRERSACEYPLRVRIIASAKSIIAKRCFLSSLLVQVERWLLLRAINPSIVV